jgi:phosphonatase-like hydrolase
MKIKLFVFDMAGTTVDDAGDSVAVCLAAALANAGVVVSHAQIDPVMGIPKPMAIRELLTLVRGGEPSDGEVNIIHEDFRARMVAHYRSDPSVNQVPGADEVFATLKRSGVRVALDTGFDREIVRVILSRLGWDGVVDDWVASDEVARGRPWPDMIHELMKRAGITDAAQVAKVGDSVSDIEEGLNAKCGWVGAIRNVRTRDELHRFPGVHAMDSIREIPAALGLSRAAGSPS